MLSQRGRYALKAAIYLARAAPHTCAVSTIAEAENIPRKFLEVVMGELRKAGLVEAQVGKGGGYRLARPGDAITFGEIVRVTDGPLALVACASQTAYAPCKDCLDETTCALRRVMMRVRAQVSDVLDHVTLADALTDPALMP